MYFHTLVTRPSEIPRLMERHDRALCAGPQESTVDFRTPGGRVFKLGTRLAPGQGIIEQCRNVARIAALPADAQVVAIRKEA